jgi:hypothetical protein
MTTTQTIDRLKALAIRLEDRAAMFIDEHGVPTIPSDEDRFPNNISNAKNDRLDGIACLTAASLLGDEAGPEAGPEAEADCPDDPAPAKPAKHKSTPATGRARKK